MKQRIKYFAASLLIATPLALTAGVALAHDEGSTSNTETSQTQYTPEQLAQKLEELKKRVNERKTDLKTKLEAARKTILENHCKAAQAIVGRLSSSAAGINENRSKAYDNLDARLTALIEKLNDNPNVDTSTLAQYQLDLETKVAVFKTDMATYLQALDDLKDMDCATDPTGFQASLEAARTARTKVVNDLKDIRNLIKDQITKSIKAIKDSIKTEEEQ